MSVSTMENIIKMIVASSNNTYTYLLIAIGLIFLYKFLIQILNKYKIIKKKNKIIKDTIALLRVIEDSNFISEKILDTIYSNLLSIELINEKDYMMIFKIYNEILMEINYNNMKNCARESNAIINKQCIKLINCLEAYEHKTDIDNVFLEGSSKINKYYNTILDKTGYLIVIPIVNIFFMFLGVIFMLPIIYSIMFIIYIIMLVVYTLLIIYTSIKIVVTIRKISVNDVVC
ncbi:hypothetical protein [Megamonas sp.]